MFAWPHITMHSVIFISFFAEASNATTVLVGSSMLVDHKPFAG